MILNIINCILVKKMTSTDQYWLSYGTAGSYFKTRHRIIKLCRAITRWISVRWRRFLRVNEACYTGYSLMYHIESTHWYGWRYGSAGFRMRNQPYLHSKIDNYRETWYFLIILFVYYRVCIYLIDCKLLGQKNKWKGFIFPPSHGIPPKWKKNYHWSTPKILLLHKYIDRKYTIT